MTPEKMAAIHAAAFTQSRPWSEDEISDLVSSPHAIVAADKYGFALGRVVAGEAELLTIAIHPTNQGQGLGSRLLTEILSAAKANGAKTMFLEVAEDNVAALALYHATGFHTTATRKDYYARSGGTPVNAFIMEQKLT